MKTVAAGDEVAGDFVFDPVLPIAHDRMLAAEIAECHVLGLIDGNAARGVACVHQVARHLGLAVDHHRAAGQRLEIDAVHRAVEAEAAARVG